MRKQKTVKEVVLPLRGPRMAILRIRKDDSESLLFLSQKIDLYEVHGQSSGTLVCTLDRKTCDGCKHHQAHKVYGACHVFDPSTKTQSVLLITAEGVHNLRDLLAGRASPRGLFATVSRYQHRANMPLVFTERKWWDEDELPSKAKPTKASLTRIWRFQDLEIDSATVAE